MPHSLSLTFSLLFLLLLPLSSPFTPPDNHLLNCGSTATATVDNRVFEPDSTRHSGNSLSLTNSKSPIDNPLYSSARLFTSDYVYHFDTKKLGLHFVRLHFSPFVFKNYDLGLANFDVFGNGLSLLRRFGAKKPTIDEFVLNINVSSFEVLFKPVGGSDFAFVNAIEVVSAPDDLILDFGAKLIGPNGVEEFKNISKQILETFHRVNVGGSKLTPFNDTLWRTWVPDNDFIVLKSAAKVVKTIHTPNYQAGGANREIAPDNVYMTAQQMNKDNVNPNAIFNVTWNFPVSPEISRYLVRLHFCDIVSQALNQLYFNVFINQLLAYKDLDLSVLTTHALASPYYIDFVVDSNNSIEVSVGPSDLSTSLRKNAILNGVEIMKMVDFSVLENIPKKKNKLVLLGSVLGGFFGLLCFIALAVLCLIIRNKKKRRLKHAESIGWTPLRAHGGSTLSRLSEGTALTSPGHNGYFGLKIAITDIELATNNFDKKLIIGSGGFGMVFKGVLRDNTKVAVKRGIPGSRQGLPEFHSEITVLSKIKHRHLVTLIGYCEEQSEMILVYEYVEKGPLKNHLYGSEFPPLSWKQRLDICIGAARGLHYLHTGFAQGIIHRDIKSTNILLDENYIAKVADFGLSRSGPCINETHVSTGVKGSFGYLDPEYFRRQQLTDKSDVYSFGVVLFEVLCARPAVDPLLAREQVNLAEWAMAWQSKGMIEQIIDPYLRGKIKISSLKKLGETAEKCVAEYGVDRPTMGDVLWNLEHALQLQESDTQTETSESDHIDLDLSSNRIVRHIPSGYDSDEREGGEGLSDVSTSQVFSQLMTNKGR